MVSRPALLNNEGLIESVGPMTSVARFHRSSETRALYAPIPPSTVENDGRRPSQLDEGEMAVARTSENTDVYLPSARRFAVYLYQRGDWKGVRCCYSQTGSDAVTRV